MLQNATVRRTVAMMQALFERYGTPVSFDGRQFFCFWQPATLAAAPEEELRALKVGYRAKSLLRVSQAFASGSVDELALRGRPASEQAQALLGLYGIGPASAGYILFDVFHQWDYLTHISPWEQKIYTQLIFGQDYHQGAVPVGEMLACFEQRYRPYRALAVHYLWEELWWRRRNEPVPWLEELIRL